MNLTNRKGIQRSLSAGQKSGVARSPLRCPWAAEGFTRLTASQTVQADVFSCGCVLFELLSWSLSFNIRWRRVPKDGGCLKVASSFGNVGIGHNWIPRSLTRTPQYPFSLTVFGRGFIPSQHKTTLEAFTCPGTSSIVCL